MPYVMFFLNQYGFFNTQKGTDTGAELSSFYSRREYLKMLGEKGALFIHFESALNLTSQHHSVFAVKNKTSVCTVSHTRRNKAFCTGLSKRLDFSVVLKFSESIFLSIV